MLNRAHYLERQAEKAARKGHIEEAIHLHKDAADILRDLLQTVIDDKVKESVRLQSQLHEKEKVVLKQQRKRCQKVYKDLETLKMNHERDGGHRTNSGNSGRRTPGSHSQKSQKSTGSGGSHHHHHHHHRRGSEDRESGSSLQSSIYRKFQETENLLDQLRIQEVDADVSLSSECASVATAVRPSSSRRQLEEGAAAAASYSGNPEPSSPDTKKLAKDDKVIIEELQTANSHLRKMVDSLFFELSACQEENHRLKLKIRELEADNQALLAAPAPAPTRAPPVVMTTFGGTPSESPRSLRRPVRRPATKCDTFNDTEEESFVGMQRIVPTEELPPLPPLDMPPAFNFGATSPTPSSTIPSSTSGDESRTTCPQLPLPTQAKYSVAANTTTTHATLEPEP